LTETNNFSGIERRRNPRFPRNIAKRAKLRFSTKLGKALTSSLQLDQVLRTIMEKIDEFLHPVHGRCCWWTRQGGALFRAGHRKNAHTLKDVRIKMGQGIAGWVAQSQQA